MRTLYAPNARRPTQYVIRYLAYGTLTRPAQWRHVAVMADSEKDARKLCKQRLRGEQYQVVSSQEVLATA